MRRFIARLTLILLVLAGGRSGATEPPAPAPGAGHAAAPGPAAPRANRTADASTATVAVDFVARAGQPPWFASALELAVVEELGRFRRIVLADERSVDTSACRVRTRRCLVEAYRAAGVDVVVLGVLGSDSLAYELDETWTGTRAGGGTLDTSDRASAKRLQPPLAALARALIETGGILDRKPRAAGSAAASPSEATAGSPSDGSRTAGAAQPDRAAAAPSTGAAKPAGSGATAGEADASSGQGDASAAGDAGPAPEDILLDSAASGRAPAVRTALGWLQRSRVFLGGVRDRLVSALREAPKPQLVLITAILLAMAPLVLLKLLLRRGESLGSRARPRSMTWAAVAVIILSAALVAVAWPVPWRLPVEVTAPVEAAWAAVVAWPALLPAVGGLAWGAVVLAVGRFVLPPLPGVERVRHDALWPVIEAYLGVVLQRAMLAALGLAPLALVAWVALAAGASRELTVLVIAPAAVLLGFVWILLLADVLTVYLDRKLVWAAATGDDPWHRALSKYFRGYARRMGLDVDPRVVDRILFLPGKEDGVASWGGGWSRPRIVVGPELREVALGELVEEAEHAAGEHHLEEWPLGLVVPPAGEAPAGMRALRNGERLRAAGIRGLAPRGAGRLIGESATLLGWVLPIPSDESVPLVSNTSEDFGVVRELLTEHYAAFEKNVDDEEYDDTDRSQKDFLYGALLVELGAVLRGQSLLATFGLALETASAHGRGPFAMLGRAACRLHRRFAARWPAVLGDAFAALNQGRDHLIQYLFFVRTRQLLPLTARASVPIMVRTSKEILDLVAAEEPDGADRQLFRATPRNRLVWLSRLFFEPIPEPRERRLRLAAMLALVVALGAAVAASVREAQRYHPVWVERMQAPATDVEKDTAPSGEQR